MWIDEIIKALERLPYGPYEIAVDRIENGIIFLSDHTCYTIKNLLLDKDE